MSQYRAVVSDAKRRILMERVEAWCKLHGQSNAELARLAGITTSPFYHAISKKHSMTVAVHDKVERVLNAAVDPKIYESKRVENSERQREEIERRREAVKQARIEHELYWLNREREALNGAKRSIPLSGMVA